MRFLLLIPALFCSKTSYSQTKSNVRQDQPEKSQSAKVFTFSCRSTETEAQVDGEHWRNYLIENLELDSMEQTIIPEGTYRLTAQILIGKNGCIEQVKIMDDPGYGLSDKVIKVISSYQQWKPAERNGRQVRAYRKLPIAFIVEKDECETNLPLESMP
jgi:hypothetical protein